MVTPWDTLNESTANNRARANHMDNEAFQTIVEMYQTEINRQNPFLMLGPQQRQAKELAEIKGSMAAQLAAQKMQQNMALASFNNDNRYRIAAMQQGGADRRARERNQTSRDIAKMRGEQLGMFDELTFGTGPTEVSPNDATQQRRLGMQQGQIPQAAQKPQVQIDPKVAAAFLAESMKASQEFDSMDQDFADE